MSERSESRSKSKERAKKNKKEKKRKKEKKQRKDRSAEREEMSPPKDQKREETMSVEETNKLRASMGLAPLSVPDLATKKREREEQEERHQEAAEAKKAEEKQEEAKRRKREKALESKITETDSLGKSLKKTSAVEWVMRSRKLGKEAELAKQRQFLLDQQDEEQQDYDSKNLAGLKVAHDLNEFKEGTSTILTLKDQPILLEGVVENDADDELQNVNMADAQRDDINNELRKKKPGYDVFNDGAESLLSKYDNIDEYGTIKKEQVDGFTLDGSGGRDEVKLRAKEAIRARLTKSDEGGIKYSLNTELKLESDYLPATFKKKLRKKKDQGKETGKPKHKKKPEAIEELSVPAPSIAEHMKDHGARQANPDVRDKEKDLRDASYLRALTKAEKQTAKMLADLKNVFEEEQDEELQSSLDRSRRLARLKADEAKAKKAKVKTEAAAEEEGEKEEVGKVRASSAPSVDALAEQMKAAREKDKIKEETVRQEQADSDDEDAGLTFTATTEFCRGLQESEKVQRVEKSIFKHKNKQRKKAAAAAAQEAEATKDLNEDTDDEEMAGSASDEEDDSFLGEEPLATSSIAATLQLIKNRGFLDDKVYRSQVGRAQDEELHLEKDDPAPHIQIRHLDDFGNELKPKQAFRVLSHVFHGRPPGLVKKEKQRQKRIADQKRQGSRVGDMNSVKKFQKRQAETGQAFVALDRKFKVTKVNEKPKKLKQKSGPAPPAASAPTASAAAAPEAVTAPIQFGIGK